MSSGNGMNPTKKPSVTKPSIPGDIGKHGRGSPPDLPPTAKSPRILTSFEQQLRGKMFGKNLI